MLLKNEVATTLDGLTDDMAAAKAHAMVTAIEILDTEVPLGAEVAAVQT